MKEFSDQKIVDSWQKNAQPWVIAVRRGQIESRLLVTNRAIMEAVLACAPNTVLDVGCGEGWLVRELAKAGMKSTGVDVVPDLIEFARIAGGGRFMCLSFQELSPVRLGEQFDVVVCNFSLLGKESVNQFFQQASSLINPGGSVIVQTLHPVADCGEEKYEDGWRRGSWAGFSDKFCDPAPWYFRTMETWKGLFLENGFRLHQVLEPVNPKTRMPASVVFIGVSDR